MPNKHYFNPFSQKTDSLEIEDLTDELDGEESKLKSGDDQKIKKSSGTPSHFAGDKSATKSSKLQGDSGSTSNVENNEEQQDEYNSKRFIMKLIMQQFQLKSQKLAQIRSLM